MTNSKSIATEEQSAEYHRMFMDEQHRKQKIRCARFTKKMQPNLRPEHVLQQTVKILSEMMDGDLSKDVEAAFSGDEYAMRSIYLDLSDELRGLVTKAFWEGQGSNVAFSVMLANSWGHDHRDVLHAAGSRKTLEAMFLRAKFQTPKELPENVVIWRGVSGVSQSRAKDGISWTTDRDTACWFAMRGASTKSKPVVLKAEVEKSDIVYFTDDRGEAEVVTFHPKHIRVDGDCVDWENGRNQCIKTREERHAIFEAEWKAAGPKSFPPAKGEFCFATMLRRMQSKADAVVKFRNLLQISN